MERRNIDKASTYWTLGMFYEYIGYIDSAFINYHKCLDYVFTKDTNDCINKLNFAICEKLLNDTLIYINPRCRMLDPQLFERLKWERKDFIASYLERTTNKRYNKK